MRYTDLLKKNEVIEESTKSDQSEVKRVKTVITEKQKPEDILRSAGLKIRMVTGTAFGTQIDFFKKPDEELLNDLLSDFSIKIKEKSVFIVE